MHKQNNSSTSRMRVLHLNSGKQYACESLGLTKLYGLISNLFSNKIDQKQIITGSGDNTHKVCIKKGACQNKEIETLLLLNTYCGVNLPRADMASTQIENCVFNAVEEFNPHIVHIHHMDGFSSSILEGLKSQYDLPLVITLHDYWYICPTARLLNYRGENCKDTAHGDNCVLCYNAKASVPEDEPIFSLWPGEFESRKFAWIHALNLAEKIICVSPDIKKQYINNGVAPEKMVVIPSGVKETRNGESTPGHIVDYAKEISKLYAELLSNNIKAGGNCVELGGGETPKQKKNGFLNLDFRAIPEVDLVADVKRLPFRNNTIGRIFAANLVEHFPRKEIQSVLLGWWKALKQGGWIDVVVPDLEETLDHWRDMPFHRVLDALYGAQKFNGDYHYNGLTQETLKELLFISGFNSIPNSLRYKLMDVPRLFMRARKKTRIRIYPFGDATKGSSRLRIHNIYPHLVGMGYDVRLFGDPGDCDVAIFQKVFDQQLVKRCHGVSILDIDDNFFEFTNSATTCKQVSKKISAIVTSTFALKKIATKYCQNKIEVIPTSVDIYRSKYKNPDIRNKKVRLAGWVGNPENLHYLGDLIRLLNRMNMRLRIITKLSDIKTRWLIRKHENIELFEWTLESADRLLQDCDVGIAPLNNDAWSIPKSGVKILKYWSLGIPVVCSPIPEYLRIASEFGVSCVAHNEEDWINLLNSSPDERLQQVQSAQNKIAKYMAPAVADQWSSVIDELVYDQHLKNGIDRSAETIAAPHRQ